ncbi:hypothetical protein [Amycolatopsis sp. NBC_01286]|uniref:hypothetical protein n=1 Tax=Amycolatopsis sp. NBC_01286 TaxID=2903560 RepID=UPI002E142B94|nr:hypothetical protein OG570_45200 [Amycolatopsis sp. NBC_01286]
MRRANRAHESLASRAAPGDPDEIRAEARHNGCSPASPREAQVVGSTLAEYVDRISDTASAGKTVIEARDRVRRRLGRPDRD